ncbi:serine hydrolase [Thalassotalea sp. G2M2-11]|uniref:serine hydrolase domain-containing protein n=1 Tax=Thalassotalea sp. G2M2-11 TaxID=2787627 RepID=UPI0019D2EC2D|nr:serine hydrolase [Thalassotalea sp. G2M2-11]
MIQAENIDFSILEKNIAKTKQLSGLASGTAIAVIKGNEVIYQANFGYADIAKKIQVSQHTPFYIASVTKPFFALNTLIDIENNNLSPSLSLAQMFPKLAIDGINESRITIKDLMSHTSGIENIPLVLATAYSGLHTAESLQNLVNHHSVNNQLPVGTFKYTNVGYNMLSIFADHHFQQPWQDRLKQQVFQPLNMTRTSAKRSDFNAQQIAIAKPYSLLVNSQPKALYLEKTNQTMHAAGGMFSTTNDLAKFIISQLNQGMLNKQQVLSADVIKTSHQQQVTTLAQYQDFQRDGYTWGWYTGEYKGERMLHHFGGFAGTHAHLSFIPKQHIGLVILNNEDFLSARMTSIIADYIYGKLLNDTDIENKMIKRFDALNQKIATLPYTLARHQQKINERAMKLSLKHSAYLGEYMHPALGKIKIALNENNTFNLSFGILQTTATGFDKRDQIRVTFEPGRGEVITFSVSDKVNSLSYAGSQFIKKR